MQDGSAARASGCILQRRQFESGDAKQAVVGFRYSRVVDPPGLETRSLENSKSRRASEPARIFQRLSPSSRPGCVSQGWHAGRGAGASASVLASRRTPRPLKWVERAALAASAAGIAESVALLHAGIANLSSPGLFCVARGFASKLLGATPGVSGRTLLVTAVRKEGLPSASQRCPSHRVHPPGSAGFRWRRKALQKRSVDSFAQRACTAG